MIIDSNESMLNNISINKGRLEAYIGCGMKKTEIISAFNTTSEEMEKWCQENYNGMNFSTVFEVVRQMSRGIYLDMMKDLGFKGNPTAISIIDKVVNSDDENANTGMVFNVNVKVESNDDKQCS
jgi:hypothetical protein